MCHPTLVPKSAHLFFSGTKEGRSLGTRIGKCLKEGNGEKLLAMTTGTHIPLRRMTLPQFCLTILRLPSNVADLLAVM